MLMGMGMDQEYAAELARSIYELHADESVTKEQLIDEIAWHPRWIEKDLTAGLRLLETETPPKIVDVAKADGTYRRKGSFPSGCTITFASKIHQTSMNLSSAY